MTNRHLILPALLLTAACATGTGAPAHPPSPDASPVVPEPAEPSGITLPPEEGVDFVVYRSDGSTATLEEIVSAAGSIDAVLVGEEHDDDVGHRVQLELFRRIAVTHGDFGPMAGAHPGIDGERPPTGSGPVRPIMLSLEMFERDVQYILDEYMDDLITETHFLSSARPWDNYETDYRPLVEFAKAHGIPVVAANAPRRYVNRASRLGSGSLTDLPRAALEYLPPLPYPEASAAYQAEWDALMGDAAIHMAGDPLDGQTLWDAAMGESIARALESGDGTLVVHLAGGFHIENGTGVPETLRHYRPETRSLTVAIRPQGTLGRLPEELEGAGDWVILTRDDPAPSNRLPPGIRIEWEGRGPP